MRRKPKRPHGITHRVQFTIICDWCGDRREVTRQDTKTCSGKCRQRLATFTRECGYPPDSIPGKVTAQQAIDLEVFRLLRQEAARRKFVSLVRSG